MNSPPVADLFVEDRAHEEFLKAMLTRISKEEGRMITVRIRSARGGHGRALKEFSLYQKSVLKASSDMGMPDLLFVAIDANCKRLNSARKEIEAHIDPPFQNRTIIACPDPHIERWYLADPDTFFKVVGIRPKAQKKKCDRDRYKAILSKAIVDAGHPPTLGGIEFAREIVDSMDLYKCSKADKALKDFIQFTRQAIRQ